ncbi:hypothetical protein DEO72_LG7g1224 [Vigna unguiculata]|uniref:Uncharacterized protein n=1 Tax=Vigna unguiculata TaxID=3917 RepID=A0A4D6MFZ6_VIGUN|nr:hypothetical protein DEO72_LG7g1224 [Vigna unguiculata]
MAVQILSPELGFHSHTLLLGCAADGGCSGFFSGERGGTAAASLLLWWCVVVTELARSVVARVNDVRCWCKNGGSAEKMERHGGCGVAAVAGTRAGRASGGCRSGAESVDLVRRPWWWSFCARRWSRWLL